MISKVDESLFCLLAPVDIGLQCLLEGDVLLLCSLLEELSVLPNVILDQLPQRLGCLCQIVGMGHVQIFEIPDEMLVLRPQHLIGLLESTCSYIL